MNLPKVYKPTTELGRGSAAGLHVHEATVLTAMEGQGRGSALLLLLMSSLLLCEDVAASPPCGNRCPPNYGDLLRPMVNLSESIYSRSETLLEDIEDRYATHSFYFMPAIRGCHTAGIIAPDDIKQPSKVEYADHLRFLLRLLYSWNEPLRHLANEAFRLPECSTHLTNEITHIATEHRKLQKLMNNVANQVDLEITNKVDYALWTELPSLQSADKETRLFAAYNLIHCLNGDFDRIKFYLKWFLCALALEC